MLVETFVTQPAVEALDEAVLSWLARRDVMPLDIALMLPSQDGARSQFCPVVADHHAGVATYLCDPIEFTRHTDVRERVVDDQRQAFPAEVIDHGQDAELAAAADFGHLVFRTCGKNVWRNLVLHPCCIEQLAMSRNAWKSTYFACDRCNTKSCRAPEVGTV
jgi:hypothetical protein